MLCSKEETNKHIIKFLPSIHLKSSLKDKAQDFENLENCIWSPHPIPVRPFLGTSTEIEVRNELSEMLLVEKVLE